MPWWQFVQRSKRGTSRKLLLIVSFGSQIWSIFFGEKASMIGRPITSFITLVSRSYKRQFELLPL